jgi:2-polyprenyl-6-methoxyphenol hydroxylase-like FAD-dependent oxidoreductase
MEVFDAIVVGGGPVGLCLSCLLAGNRARVLVLERQTRPSQTSRAIGVTPPSLRIADGLGVAGELIARGTRVTRAYVHGDGPLGSVSFDLLPQPFRFILSVPQTETEEVLRGLLEHQDNATFLAGAEAESVDLGVPGGPLVRWRRAGRVSRAQGRFLCGCDGAGSLVRRELGLRFRGGPYRRFFLMADYASEAGLGRDAHLYFTPRGSVESFPLPGGKRRWIAQTGALLDPHPAGALEEIVHERTGIALEPAEATWRSSFQPGRYEAEAMAVGPVALCGDAAHVMAPIGGQGMNTGFADAELLAALLHDQLQRNGAVVPPAYESYRRRAVRSAARRAAASMNVGTITGPGGSGVRNALIRMLLHSPFRRAVPPHFAMLTIPFGSLAEVVARAPVLG